MCDCIKHVLHRLIIMSEPIWRFCTSSEFIAAIASVLRPVAFLCVQSSSVYVGLAVCPFSEGHTT